MARVEQLKVSQSKGVGNNFRDNRQATPEQFGANKADNLVKATEAAPKILEAVNDAFFKDGGSVANNAELKLAANKFKERSDRTFREMQASHVGAGSKDFLKNFEQSMQKDRETTKSQFSEEKYRTAFDNLVSDYSRSKLNDAGSAQITNQTNYNNQVAQLSLSSARSNIANNTYDVKLDGSTALSASALQGVDELEKEIVFDKTLERLKPSEELSKTDPAGFERAAKAYMIAYKSKLSEELVKASTEMGSALTQERFLSEMIAAGKIDKNKTKEYLKKINVEADNEYASKWANGVLSTGKTIDQAEDEIKQEKNPERKETMRNELNDQVAAKKKTRIALTREEVGKAYDPMVKAMDANQTLNEFMDSPEFKDMTTFEGKEDIKSLWNKLTSSKYKRESTPADWAELKRIKDLAEFSPEEFRKIDLKTLNLPSPMIKTVMDLQTGAYYTKTNKMIDAAIKRSLTSYDLNNKRLVGSSSLDQQEKASHLEQFITTQAKQLAQAGIELTPSVMDSISKSAGWDVLNKSNNKVDLYKSLGGFTKIKSTERPDGLHPQAVPIVNKKVTFANGVQTMLTGYILHNKETGNVVYFLPDGQKTNARLKGTVRKKKVSK